MSSVTRRLSAISLTAKLSLPMMLLAGCGQDPAFTETNVTAIDSPAQPGNKGTSADGVAGSDSTPSGSSSGGASDSASTGSGGSGGSTGGASDSASTGSGGSTTDSTPVVTPPPYTPPTGYPAGTPESNVLVEDGGTMVMPGVKAVKVGVNFEDLSDFDLNDSVLCFTGSFKVDGPKVTSYKKQTILAAVTNNSACGHNIHVTISDANGVVTQRLTYNDRVTTSAQLNFDVGSKLWVVMENQANNSGCIGPIGMDHPSRAEVKPNLCRR